MIALVFVVHEERGSLNVIEDDSDIFVQLGAAMIYMGCLIKL